MGQGIGQTTLTFPDSPQAAQYAVSTVVTDSAPNPNTTVWNQQTLPTNAASWSSIGFGANVFVAFGGSATSITATSPDGITWTQRAFPVSATWNAVAYGNSTFVAVASTTIAATSTNGLTWTQQTMPVSATWYSIAYGNSTFVAISASGTNIAATSPDGVTWTQQTLPVAASSWASITYGNNTFVAVAAGAGTIAATSPDGVTWTQQTLPATASWQSVTYGNGVFVAVALSGIAATSTNGVTWVQRTLPAGAVTSVAYGNELFVVLSSSNTAFTSPDGITWAIRYLPVNANWQKAAYGNNTFAAVALTPTLGATSPDGIGGATLPNTRTTTTVNTQIVPAYPVPGTNTASTTVTGLTAFTDTDTVQTWLMADSTSDYNSYEHKLAPLQIRVKNPITGVGFTIEAVTDFRLTGTFKVRYAFIS